MEVTDDLSLPPRRAQKDGGYLVDDTDADSKVVLQRFGAVTEVLTHKGHEPIKMCSSKSKQKDGSINIPGLCQGHA